jgi:tetratricopeptide (TPR) repeat protein
MTATQSRSLVFVALICLVSPGCSLESKEEKQARAELVSAGEAAAEGKHDLALRHVNESLSLHPLPNAYGMRAIIHMQQQNIDAAAADVKLGLELDPENTQLMQLDHQLASMKRMAGIQRSMQGPSLSDVYQKAQASDRAARETLKNNQ